jgi:uncharacterized protein (TIGR03435 family)
MALARTAVDRGDGMSQCFCARAALWFAALTPGVAIGQDADGLRFEVAAVRQVDSSATPHKSAKGVQGADPDMFAVRNRTLQSLILMAYEIDDSQLFGGPGWIGTDRFDIAAKPPRPASRHEMMLMLRTLIAERFQLRLRHESRPVTAYALTVAKGGPKFGPSFHAASDQEIVADEKQPSGQPGLQLDGTMKEFAFLLRMNMRLYHPDDAGWSGEPPPVIDQTGLAGAYIVHLPFTGPKDDLTVEAQSQLGLRLDLRKIPMDALVIVSVAKPLGN